MAPREGLPGLDSSLSFSTQRLDHLFLVFHGAGDPYVDHPPWLQSLETSLSKLQANYDLVRSTLDKLNKRIPIIDPVCMPDSNGPPPPSASSQKPSTRASDVTADTNEPGQGQDESESNKKPAPPSIVTVVGEKPSLPTALFLPVEWHRSAFETWQSQVRVGDPRPQPAKVNGNNNTMVTTVREALNDTLGDMLMMSSPFWRETIARHVSKQIDSQIAAVFRNRPAFTGRVSLLAHSVGSIIALELIHQKMLPCDIDALFMTGCPVPTYAVLSPDNQHCLATIRRNQANIRFINVYHPLDPVAYRLEPFIMTNRNVSSKCEKGDSTNDTENVILPPVKVASKKRSFWEDAELFWDDVVYNLWSSLFPRKNNRIQGDDGAHHEQLHDGRNQGTENEKGKDDFMRNLFSAFNKNDHSNDNNNNNHNNSSNNFNRKNSAGGSALASVPPSLKGDLDRKLALRRSSSYVLKGDGKDGSEQVDETSGEVLLSGRIDYELQDGMGVPPIDVMASWGAIKAHTYYWQSLDVAQMLLDVAMTSESAVSSRRSGPS